jgi:hypothetical protein
LGINALEYFQEDPLRPWDQFLRFYDTLASLEGSAVFEAQLLDPDVIEEMASMKNPPKASPPRLFGWTKEYAALRDLLDQTIAGQGGKKFTPRPRVPGLELRWKRKDEKLHDTVARLTGEE